MVVNLCEYAAAFNFALLTSLRSFPIHSTTINRKATRFFLDAGYIRAGVNKGRMIEIFPFHGIPTIRRITAISTPSRPVWIGPTQINKELFSGNKYIFLSPTGAIVDSFDCSISFSGGQVLIQLNL
jgi:hypothetical protein